MEQTVKILEKQNLTHDVLRIVAEKPADLVYQPGQAVDISLNKPGWEHELRAFTFTSLPGDPFIEFTIKTYPEHGGVTNELLTMKAGDEIMIHGVFGDIAYKGEGLFIAGGAGVTPFIAILKQLEKENKIGNNKLLFANKTKSDIILESSFQNLLGNNFINVLSNEKITGYEQGFISAAMIQKYSDNPSGYYYLCGPPPMMDAIEKHFETLGISKEKIVKEVF